MSSARIVFVWILVAATSSTMRGDDSFWSRLTVQQTLDKTVVAEAASISFVSPAGKDTSYAISCGVRFNIAPKTVEEVLELGPFIEYSRNTDVKKEQNSLRTGLSFDWTTGDLSQASWVGIVTGKVNYARQPLKESEAFQVSLLLTGLPRSRGDRPGEYWLPNIRRTLGPIYGSFGPYAGLEYERVFTAKDAAQEGSVLRVVGRVQLALQGKKGAALEKFEALIAYEYRRDVHDSTTVAAGRDHGLFKSSLTFYLLKSASDDDKKNVGISLEYANGADPAKGLEKQEYTQLSLRVRL